MRGASQVEGCEVTLKGRGPLRVMHVSHSATYGGAARAAARLHDALKGSGIESFFYSRGGARDRSAALRAGPLQDLNVRMASRLGAALSNHFVRDAGSLFSLNLGRAGLSKQIRRVRPDLVHLHWINHGLVGIESLAEIRIPVVWTLHDMWPFTGGCHYSGPCTRFEERCGACPMLKASRREDLSRWVWERKQRSLRDLDLTAIAPSRWIADVAKSSSLFSGRRVHVIPNGIPLSVYGPKNRSEARSILGLPIDRSILLYGASGVDRDRRKGMDLFLSLVRHLARDRREKSLEVVVFGAAGSLPTTPENIEVRNVGVVDDEGRLALLYGSADAFVVTSREDNYPNTVIESMACGTPVAAFNVGGIGEMIDSDVNGVLANPFDVVSLGSGINRILSSPWMRRNAAASAQNLWSDVLQGARVERLYHQVLKERRESSEVSR